VSYEKRQAVLEALENIDTENEAAQWKDLWESRANANIKLALINKLFTTRRRQPNLFLKGKYVPLQVTGTYQENILAFARWHQQEWIAVAVPLHTAQIAREQDCDLSEIDWKDTQLVLPNEAPSDWKNLLLHTEGKALEKIAVSELFKELPFAIVQLKSLNERNAGILLHLTSLPTPF